MIRKTIEQWLKASFRLPVYEDFEQTNVEKSVSYDLTQRNIKVRNQSDTGLWFEVNMRVLFRCPAGFAGIGYLSAVLADKKQHVPDFNLVSVEGYEVVEYDTKTEMIISKPIQARVFVEYNKVRDLIKCVQIEGALECLEGCNNE